MSNSNRRLWACNLEFLGRQLKLWKRYGVPDSYAIKLMKIWIGYETRDLMDEFGRYPAQNFYELRRRLSYSSYQKFIDSVRTCRSFYAVGLADGTITHIFSPVWHKYEESDGCLIFGHDLSQDCAQDRAVYITENIYNNTTVGNAEAFSPEGEGERLGEIPDKKVRLGIVRNYFKWMETSGDSDHKAFLADIKYRICNPRNKKGEIVEELKLSEQQGDEVWQILTDRILANYLSGREQFFSDKYMTHPERRIYWMKNLMKKYGFGFIKDARNLWQKQHVEIEAEMAKKLQAEQKKYRPMCEFEWMDEDGVRWYEDHLSKPQQIPADASPRPSATSTYNLIKKEWRERNI